MSIKKDDIRERVTDIGQPKLSGISISKAIKLLTCLADRQAHISQADEQKAAKLGIKALERIEHGRLFHNHICLRKLPGETED